MGEIGVDRHTFLYELKHWEILSIIRGYRRRAHTAWETTRWQTFLIAKMLGAKDIGNSPAEWHPMPWEKEAHAANIPTDEEIEEMRRKYGGGNKDE